MKKFLNIFKNINYFSPSGKEKKYPKVLQFPITYRCNSKCKICNIWTVRENELSFLQLKKVFEDNIFKNINSVGISGGEPSLVPNLEDYVKLMVCSLPRLRSLNIISNGFESKALLIALKRTYLLCKKNNIKLHISISLDGYAKMHDECRGVMGAFEKTTYSIKEIKKNLNFYADSYDVACTISQLNVDHVIELDQFVKSISVPIKYRMGVEIKRLLNKNIYDTFNATESFSAKEYIFKKAVGEKGLFAKFRYYSIFNSIISKNTERLAGCLWQNEGITLDPYGNIYYCAVRSKALGNILKSSGEEIFFNKDNLKHRSNIVASCNSCLHDYSGKPHWKNFFKFLRFLLFERFWTKTYKLKRHFL